MGLIYNPRILQCMHFKTDTITPAATRTVMDYEMDFSVGCDRIMELNGKEYKIEKGCFVVRTPGQKVQTKGVYDCYMLTLDFSNRQLSHYTRNTATKMQEIYDSEIWDILPDVFKPAHFGDYERIFKELLSVNELDINENEKTPILVNELLHLAVADALFSSRPSMKKPTDSIDEVCFYIKEHYMEEISLDTLASVAHLNKNYMIRRFKKNFGISPVAYLIKLRMDYAKKLLAETNLPIKTIAAQCGYHDPSFFNFYFKKTFCDTPMSYRESQKVWK